MKYIKRFTSILTIALVAVILLGSKASQASSSDEWREVNLNMSYPDQFRTYVHDNKLYFVNTDNYGFVPKGKTQLQINQDELTFDNESALEYAFGALFNYIELSENNFEIYSKDHKKIKTLTLPVQELFKLLKAPISDVENFNNSISEIDDFDGYFRWFVDLNIKFDQSLDDDTLFFYNVQQTYFNHVINFYKLNESGSHWYMDFDYINKNWNEILYLSNAIVQNSTLLNLDILPNASYNQFGIYNQLQVSLDSKKWTNINVDFYKNIENKHISNGLINQFFKDLEGNLLYGFYNQSSAYNNPLNPPIISKELLYPQYLPSIEQNTSRFFFFDENGKYISYVDKNVISNTNPLLENDYPAKPTNTQTHTFEFSRFNSSGNKSNDTSFNNNNQYFFKVLKQRKEGVAYDFQIPDKTGFEGWVIDTKLGGVRFENYYYTGQTINPNQPGIIGGIVDDAKANPTYYIIGAVGVVALIGIVVVLSKKNSTIKTLTKAKASKSKKS